MKKTSKILAIILICILGLFIVRFLFGGNEDTWICKDNQWIKHGNPSSPMPSISCNED
jgi:hypothetical protein